MNMMFYGVYVSSAILVFLLFLFSFFSYKISKKLFLGVLLLFAFFSLRFLNDMFYFIKSKNFFLSIFMVLWFLGMFFFMKGGCELK